MAEKAVWPHALVVALTYDDTKPGGYEGARQFCYADVRAFLKRVASACRYHAKKHKLGFVPRVRFLCAGEQGDRNGRCHWHLILFSDLDLTTIGTFHGMRGGKKVELSKRSDLMTVGKRKRRLDWSLWGLGIVTLQEPDQGGMSYVLSYCLKDQFTVEKSRGTMRQGKAENFATGLFRMSKRPAIGEEFIWRKLEALYATGAVLPSLQISVPDFGGYWYPSGTLRKKLLWGLVALNQRVVWDHGRNAPQWASLVASCKDSEKDMEVLDYDYEKQRGETEAELSARIDLRSKETGRGQRTYEIKRNCASALPCTECLHELDEPTLGKLGLSRVWWGDASEWTYETREGEASTEDLQGRKAAGINPYCRGRGSKTHRLLFPVTGSTSAVPVAGSPKGRPSA
jgi:hypothetical protein